MVPLLLATGFSFQIGKIEVGKDGEKEILNRDGQFAAVGLFLILYTAAYSPGAGVRALITPMRSWVSADS